jgi:hypothetical protein
MERMRYSAGCRAITLERELLLSNHDWVQLMPQPCRQLFDDRLNRSLGFNFGFGLEQRLGRRSDFPDFSDCHGDETFLQMDLRHRCHTHPNWHGEEQQRFSILNGNSHNQQQLAKL